MTTAEHATFEYRFLHVSECNMCGASTSDAKVLGKRMNRSQGLRPTSRVGITTTVVKCRSCGLIFSNPLPIPPDLAQHYGIPPEEYWVPSYFQIEGGCFAPQIARYRQLAGATSLDGHRSLDVGAGIGKCMGALAQAGFTSFGLEPSAPFHKMAIERMAIPLDRLQFATVEEAEYAEASFDLVTFGAVLEHLYDPAASIARALSWTKPGGLVHLEVPSSEWLTNRIANLVYAVQGLDYAANISPMHSPFHLYEFHLKSFQKNAIRTGYQIAHSEFLVCSTYLPRWADFIVRPLMTATNTGMQLEMWLRKPHLKAQ